MKSDSTMTQDKALIVLDQDEIPEDLPILTVEKQVAFPGLNMTLMISTNSLTLLEKAMKDNRVIGVLGVEEQTAQQPIFDQTSKIGTVARILYMTRAADNNAVLVVYGLTRFQITRWLSDKPYPKAQVTLAPEILEADIETEALHRSLRDLSQDVF
ncbi:MAG: LON peptidase substrate-binding domain-containing protein, partial [Desulfobacteraceae bacterium]